MNRLSLAACEPPDVGPARPAARAAGLGSRRSVERHQRRDALSHAPPDRIAVSDPPRQRTHCRGGRLRLEKSHAGSVEFEWLPAYASELNPVEARWSHTKYGQLANFVPDDAPQLKRSVRSALKNNFANITSKVPSSSPHG